MNALEALGIMAVEKNIVQIRNIKPAVILVKADLLREGGDGLLLLQPEIVADTWELGWSCSKCCGSGTLGVGHSNSPDYEEVSCPHCTGGIRWETEY